MMPGARPDCAQHADWFELTNRGTNAVNLLGYRFADRFTLDILEDARVVSPSVIVRPGESAIFVERMNADEFRQWWGAERLPPELPIITYIGLGFSQELGDELYLWSPGAEDPFDYIASISFASATPGVSLDFTENTHGKDSVPGKRGAFVAIECGDIGSPGYVTNPPPRFVRISHDESTATIKWSAIAGRTYQLKYKEYLDAEWQDLVRRTAQDWVETHSDPTEGWPSQRFYFIEEQP